ncbi:hypothetical protein L1887_17583 [Cichorium endivia]|nr:hypothetical protein L1887_17583 [Cichorium endivia]
MMADKRGIRKLLKELPYFHGVVICKLILDGVQDSLPGAVICRLVLDGVQGSLAGAVMCNLVLESRSSLVGTGMLFLICVQFYHIVFLYSASELIFELLKLEGFPFTANKLLDELDVVETTD